MVAVQRRTPGVYVTELNAFPPSVVGVETAVPAFIGYTAKALQNGKSVTNKPVRIGSLADYQEIFGTGYPAKFGLKEEEPADITIGDKRYTFEHAGNNREFYLHNSLKLFYANGGGACYIVSVGNYPEDGAKKKDLIEGLKAIEDEVGPTMLVVPDAIAVELGDYNDIVQEMLAQCDRLRDRVAILDIHLGDTLAPNGGAKITDFRKGVGTKGLSYGMAYYPWLHTSVIQADDVNYSNLNPDAITVLKKQLIREATPTNGTIDATLKDKIDKIADNAFDKSLNQDLMAALPVLTKLYAAIAEKLNVLPASGAMAGVYTYVDSVRGVWNAPANISLTGVIGPTIKINNTAQEDLNVPIEGKAINAIRDFVGRGTLIWGARTLDSNSNDYRYIQVRRTLIYIEQSIKAALNQFVFAPNNAQTWVTVTAMITNFLTELWTQGGLMGGKASEAFTVQCGLGSTMTGNDVLNGYMRVQVTLQMIHPAEFIELTFTQKMQGVA